MTISVIFYYTEAFEAVTPDIKGHIQHLIDCANGTFLLSGIAVLFKIHCMLKIDMREAPNSNDRIKEFRDSQGETILDVLLISYYLAKIR